MATNNSWNSQYPAQVAAGGTGSSTLTAYNILIGNGTSAVSLVAPSATSGVPLISQGAASNPTYGTAVVAGGGTGNTTFTAYSVLCAGTTATGAFQNVSGLGSAGQLLTSNGAGALPTWQNAPSSGITTINGNTGSVTGSTITITGTQGSANFSGSGTTLTLGFTYGTQNTYIGSGCGNVPTSTGSYNTGFGYQALGLLSSGQFNCALGRYSFGGNALTGSGNTGNGYFCGQAASGAASYNTAIGYGALGITGPCTGSYNVCIGANTAYSYNGAESYNILIGARGVAAETYKTRIGYVNATGTTSTQTGCFIDGISGKTTSTSGAVTFTDTTGNLGTVAGGAMTMNTGTNALSISTDASATTVNIATGAAAKTVALGSTNTTSATTINSGSGGVIMTGVASVSVSNKNYVTINTSTGALGSDSGPSDPGAGCSFNAVLASNSSRSAGIATVVFGTEDFDNGSVYANGTGIFTAPATGIYQFSYSLDAYLGSASDYAGFNVNNGTYYSLSRFTNSAATDFVNFSGSITLSLSSSDTVRIFYSSASGSSVIQGSGRYQSYFCGYRIA